MEITKKEKVLSTLVDFVGKEDFSFKELDIIVQEVTPESKNNIISQDLKECFGESIIFKREPSPRGHGSRIIFKFKDDTDLLKKKINQYSVKKKYRLKKEIAINVYEYLEFLPVIVSDVFNELKKNGINCTGLNFSEWCRKNPHFIYCNYQILLKGDYCEIINKKPLLSKKEGTGTEVKKENEEIFYIISPDNLKETKNISFNKKIENLKIYKITVDYYDVFISILNAYNLIIKYTVLGDEIVAKVTKLVKESIAEKIERKI